MVSCFGLAEHDRTWCLFIQLCVSLIQVAPVVCPNGKRQPKAYAQAAMGSEDDEDEHE